jgi:hypothetical protein
MVWFRVMGVVLCYVQDVGVRNCDLEEGAGLVDRCNQGLRL